MMVKDVCYAALFDKNDLPYVYRLAEEIRATHNQDLVDDLNNKCQRKFDDHLGTRLEIGGKNIEFLQTSKADDLVVTAGINQCIDLILGVSVTRWQYMAKGVGTTAPTAGNVGLETEHSPRVDMSLFGWREYASTSLRFGAIFPEFASSDTISEVGVFSPAGTPMLNRNVFANFPISHVTGVTGFLISSVIEFVPMM